jgi:predicted DNA-binding protein (MmcQ/YjbR family)
MTELHYPKKHWLSVFTDGSQADEANTAWNTGYKLSIQ